MKQLLFIFLFIWTVNLWALEGYQGQDYKVDSWRCGAPMIEALRSEDNDGLLQDPTGQLKLKESLEAISTNNIKYLKNKLGTLSADEKSLLTLISTKFKPAIVHRTDLGSSKIILTNGGLVSATKRGVSPRITPDIEQGLFSGRDCIFAAVGLPYGIENYGTTIFRFKNKEGFAWGSIYTGLSWTVEVAQRSYNDSASNWMKRRFARQIFTNNHWNEALGLQIIGHIRNGTSIRGKGPSYDKSKILSELLAMKTDVAFWKRVAYFRLGFLEAHYTDNVGIDDFQFVQFRTKDTSAVTSWGLPSAWFDGDQDAFIQYFSRDY